MAQRRPRPCLDCQTLTRNPSRCDSCQIARDQTVNAERGSATARGYGAAWQRIAKAVLARHRRLHGDMCPGWQRPAHPATDLTVDHWIPKAKGGTDDPENLTVLCRSCNSAKGSG